MAVVVGEASHETHLGALAVAAVDQNVLDTGVRTRGSLSATGKNDEEYDCGDGSNTTKGTDHNTRNSSST